MEAPAFVNFAAPVIETELNITFAFNHLVKGVDIVLYVLLSS